VSALESLSNGVRVAYRTTSGVYQPSALLHLTDEILVEQAAGFVVKRAVDGDDVTLRDHLLERFDSSDSDLGGSLLGKGGVVEVEQFLC
jgi:hypothetical protein